MYCEYCDEEHSGPVPSWVYRFFGWWQRTKARFGKQPEPVVVVNPVTLACMDEEMKRLYPAARLHALVELDRAGLVCWQDDE